MKPKVNPVQYVTLFMVTLCIPGHSYADERDFDFISDKIRLIADTLTGGLGIALGITVIALMLFLVMTGVIRTKLLFVTLLLLMLVFSGLHFVQLILGES